MSSSILSTTHNSIIFSALTYSADLGCYVGFYIYFLGFSKLIEFISWDVVRIGKDFFLIIFSYFFIRKVKRFAEFSDRCKNLPTFYNTITMS
jgi:hypothetical protein